MIDNQFKKYAVVVSKGLYIDRIRRQQKEQKIRKEEYINLNLEKNIDILNYVSNHNSLRPKLVIGFAAETHDINKNAKKKLMEKNCDWIIANLSLIHI